MEALPGAEFTGVVGSDRWSAYNWFAAEQRTLWTFARVERVELTNNVSERALRPVVSCAKGVSGRTTRPGADLQSDY